MPTLDEVIGELKRELRWRSKNYPALVYGRPVTIKRKLSAAESGRRIGRLISAIETLERCAKARARQQKKQVGP